MKHAPSVVIVSWQRSEHGYSSLRYETCSVSCHRDMTTVRAWLYIIYVWNMLRKLSSWHDNGQSMVIYHLCMKHAPTVVIVTWQLSEHGYISFMYETCSDSCHRDMTTVRAWLYIIYVWNMLRTVVIVTWQRSEHGYISFMYETCSDSCHRLRTMDREGKKHAPSVVIVSWRRSEHGYSSFR